MIRDITLGQFYPGNSWVHRLDARVKIMVTLLYIVSIFVVKDFIGFALEALGLAVVIAISRVPLKFILRGLKPIFILIAFTFVINMFMIKGEVLVSFWIFSISREGLRMAIFMAIRLILLIIVATLPLFAVLPPFKRFGLPAHDLAMMMTIALRFIPTLLEETDKIMKAQMARGADFESGNILRRAKALIPILVPLFISAFRIAQDLAMAMEARCYGSNGKKTRMNGMKICSRDIVACLIFAAFLAMIILERILL